MSHPASLFISSLVLLSLFFDPPFELHIPSFYRYIFLPYLSSWLASSWIEGILVPSLLCSVTFHHEIGLLRVFLLFKPVYKYLMQR